ncbi:MAG: hypothetical protein ABI692_11305 [Terracoccus sp.]
MARTSPRPRLRHLLMAGGAVAALTCVTACGKGTPSAGSPPGPSAAAGSAVTVVADMFSGKPNPSWKLSQTEADRLTACLRAGTVADTPAEDRDGDLGFRTFAVAGLPDALTYTAATIAPDSVTANTADGMRAVTGCADGYSVLRASAESHLSAAEFQAIPKGTAP